MFNQGFLAHVYEERPSEQVVTRFPPEPKGVRAIVINFGFARYHEGKTKKITL